MVFTKAYHLLISSLLLLSLIGCAVTTKENQFTKPNVTRSGDVVGLDNLFLDISNQLPEFAGLYVTDDLGISIKLVKANYGNGPMGSSLTSAEIERVVEDMSDGLWEKHKLVVAAARTSRGADTEIPIRFEAAEYPFRNLIQWKKILRRNISDPSANFYDINEKQNVVEIGLSDMSVVSKLQSLVVAWGIPLDAVLFSFAERFIDQATLDEKFRPTVGGIRIETTTNRVPLPCTLGYSVTLNGVRGFLTASHCSETYAFNDSNIVSQPRGLFNRIGIEHTDPEQFSGGACSRRYECRYSDASFFRYTKWPFPFPFPWWSRIRGEPLTIARPSVGLDLRNPNDRYRYIEYIRNVFQGTPVHKVGMTTGSTSGIVEWSCVDVEKGYQLRQELLCQNVYASTLEGEPVSLGGDSGSPVLALLFPYDALIVGIHWGGQSNGKGIFSGWEGLTLDFGDGLVPLGF